MLGLPRIWPVRGEPRARRRRRGREMATGVVLVGFRARVSLAGVVGWGNVGLGWPARVS